MITLKKILLIPILILPLLFACSKDSSTDPPPPVDTLGTGWKKIAMPDVSFNDIFFINNNTGYTVGDADIFRSADGGNSWQKVYHSANGLTNIAMGSESNIVFISFPTNKIIFTNNVGLSFDSVIINDQISDAFFVSSTTVYAVGNSFWKSINAGISWSKLYDFPSPFGGYESLHFLNDQNGWVAGIGGGYKTINGGTTWEQKTAGADFDFSSATANVFFVDLNQGYLSDGSRIGKTANGGSSWIKVFTGPRGYQDLHFLTAATGYITDGSYIYKTTNGGSSWSKEVVLPHSILVELHFTDANHGWGCGTEGALLKYQN